MSSTRAQKRLLEKARQDKAAAKRERRQSRGVATGDDAAEAPTGAPAGSESEVLAALAALHEQYADGAMSLEDFETARTELIERLHIS